MSRVEKFGKGRKPTTSKSSTPALEAESRNEQKVGGLPTRRDIHPSNKQQMAKLFYRTIILLFISLLIGLVLWGYRYAEF